MSSQFRQNYQPYKFEKFNLVRLPEVKLNEFELAKFGVASAGKSNTEILKELTFASCAKRGITDSKYIDKINSELLLINELEFTDYYLLVWRVINKMRELNAFVDYGRGSAAGSLVFYVLGVTNVDPIKEGLFFERFISRTRAKKQTIDGSIFIQGDLAPDVDLNLGNTRDQIVAWLNEIYKGKICKITNYRTLSGPLLIKEVTKSFLGYHESQAKEVADLIEKVAGVTEDIENMPAKNEHFKKWTEENPEAFSMALKLRDLVIGKSSHASGYVISYYDLDGFVPLELNKEKELASSYNMKDVSNFVLKLDLLGLTTNQIIKDILDVTKIDVDSINLENDPIIYDQFQTKNALLPYGLYQISADTAYKVTQAVKPANLSELSDVNALARPGALAYVDGYVKNKSESPHPLFDHILAPTRNHILFQEQLLQLLVVVGFTLEEAETARRVIGKKLTHEVKEWEQKIKDKVKENKLPSELATILWKCLDDSSKYSFNKCLSPDSVVESKEGLKLLHEIKIGDKIKSFNRRKKEDHFVSVLDVIHGERELYEIELEDGRKVKCSLDHKFLTTDGMQSVREILKKKSRIITD